MSLLNLNNFFNLITGRGREAKSVKDTDVLPLGRMDDRASNGYKPLGIRAKVLKDYLGSGAKGENTWNINKVAFLSTFGDDGTAVLGDGNKKFRTFAAAQADAEVIFVTDGEWGTETLLSFKTIICYPGVKVFRFRDNGATVTNTKVLGYAKISSNGYGLELTGDGSDVYMEVDEFDDVRTIAAISGVRAKGYIKARKVFCNGANGAGPASFTENESTLILEIEEELTLYYWLHSSGGANNTFIFKGPKQINIIPGGAYGAVGFSSLVNYQGSVTSGNTWEIDFRGGRLDRTRGQGTAFGVNDSALLAIVNTSLDSNPGTIKFKNGFIDAGNTLGILVQYALYRGMIELENIKIKTTSKPIEIYQGATNLAGADVKVIAKKCDFEGDLNCELGHGRVGRFFDCNFKTLTGVSNFIFNPANSATPGEYYFVNCNADLENTGELFTGFSGITIGLLNTNHNEPLGVGAVDTYGGANLVPTFKLPNIEL